MKANPGKETFGIVDKNTGAMMASVRGDVSSVDIAGAVKRIDKLDDTSHLISVHNHPNSVAFSPEDVIVASRTKAFYQMDDFYAFGNNRENVFRMRMTDDAVYALRGYELDNAIMLWEDYYRKGILECKEGYKITAEQMNIYASIVANRKMAKKFGYEFTGVYRETWRSGLLETI